MFNSIIISSCLISSVYIHSKSLDLIKISLSENKKIPQKLIIMNVLSFMTSSSLILYSFKLFCLSHFLKG